MGKQLTDEQAGDRRSGTEPVCHELARHAMFATKKITPRAWMGIAATAAHKACVAQAVRRGVRPAIARADGFISVWDAKYRSHVVRQRR